jgi:hypothetical protein
VQSIQTKDPVLAQLLGQPAPPILPGNPAFQFQALQNQAQMMLAPAMPAAPGGAPGEEPPANDQQQPAPSGAQPEAAE